MRLLLDSNAVIWYAQGSPRLGARATEAIGAESHEKFVSVASIWELMIKASAGKLRVSGDLRERLRTAGFTEMLVTGDHAVRAARLPPIHLDPFDRMLVAQAQTEGLTLITSDRTIGRYDVAVLPAG